MEANEIVETDPKVITKYFSILGSQVSASVGILGPLITPKEIISDNYFILNWVLSSILLGILYYFIAAPFVSKLQLGKEKYWLNSGVLYVNTGLIFKRKTSIIPRNITDITIAQGPILAIFNIWIMKVQTAGKGDHSPEVRLVGVKDMESLKNNLLTLAKLNA